MSNVNEPYQNIKDALYTAEQFFAEKKEGQTPLDISSILQFYAVLSKNDLEAQINDEFRRFLTTPKYIEMMRKGILVKTGAAITAGTFFRSDAAFAITFEDTVFTLNIFSMLQSVSAHGKRTDNLLKSDKVNLYIINVLSRAFICYITRIGHGFIEKKLREEIIGNTIVSSCEPIYSSSDRNRALKALAMDILSQPGIKSGGEKFLGPQNFGYLSTAAENFDTVNVGGLGEAVNKSLRTGKFAPIQEAGMNFLTTTGGNMHAKDGIRGCDQE